MRFFVRPGVLAHRLGPRPFGFMCQLIAPWSGWSASLLHGVVGRQLPPADGKHLGFSEQCAAGQGLRERRPPGLQSLLIAEDHRADSIDGNPACDEKLGLLPLGGAFAESPDRGYDVGAVAEIRGREVGAGVEGRNPEAWDIRQSPEVDDQRREFAAVHLVADHRPADHRR
jgi:hypothetical protein